MHILLVSYEFPPAMATGGIGSYLEHLAHLLFRKGHTVSVISATEEEEQVVDRGFCKNYLIPTTDQKKFPELALHLFDRYFEPTEIDLIESPEVGACALEIKQKYPQIPLLVKMHTPGVLITKISNTYQPLFTKLRYVAGALFRGRLDLGYWSSYDRNKNNDPEYIICSKADLILSPSAALKKWAITYWRLPEDRIQLLANPFTADEDFFHFPLEKTSKTICFVGKLTVLKGMITFTPAIREILEANPSYNAVIIGRDEPVSNEFPSMKEWMLQHLSSASARVRFTGVLNGAEVKKELGNSAIVVIPSLWENYPTVVLEAMAAGCAVAASKTGGIPEIIKHERNGLLFNPLKKKSIVAAVQQLISDKAKRERFANAGREAVRNNNDEVFITATEKIYGSIAKQPR